LLCYRTGNNISQVVWQHVYDVVRSLLQLYCWACHWTTFGNQSNILQKSGQESVSVFLWLVVHYLYFNFYLKVKFFQLLQVRHLNINELLLSLGADRCHFWHCMVCEKFQNIQTTTDFNYQMTAMWVCLNISMTITHDYVQCINWTFYRLL